MASPPQTQAAVATGQAPSPAGNSHYNNFDAIRIVAAFTVLYSHQFALTGRPEPSFFGMHSWGGISVIVFFVVSGFLVTGSWYNDPNVLRFGARRFLRLWPALTTVVVLTAYGLGAWVTTLPLGEYWKHQATWDYLHTLRMQIYYVLPGVFESNPYAHGVNGSLWTIPLEVRCYVVLAIAGFLRLMRWRTVWLGFIAAYITWFVAKNSADLTGHVHYGRELSAFFLCGSALFILRESWERKPLLWLGTTGTLAAALWLAGWHYTATLVFLPLLVLYVGTRSTPVVCRCGRWGDPSYGAYLLAFPIQQTVIHFLYPQWGFGGTLALSTLVTAILAYASWHTIEKSALRLKPGRKPPGNSPLRKILPYWPRRQHPAHEHTTQRTPATGLLLILLCGVLAIGGQSFYFYRSGATATRMVLGGLPILGTLLLLIGSYLLSNRLRHPWIRRILQTAMTISALIIGAATMVASIGFWKTGTIPRLEQLHGLTWDIVAPSVRALADQYRNLLLLGAVGILCMLVVLWVTLHQARKIHWPPAAIWLAGGALLAGSAIAGYGPNQAQWFVAVQLLHTDLDIDAALTTTARHAENEFFDEYYKQLGEVEKEPRYPDIYEKLRASNVIWVVMESVRAKDVPLYGGKADMPNFMKAREHMLLLDHLYVQEPRSTKSYTQMDLGKFSLLSWSTYSNNIPWMFPQDGLASHLVKQGYSTVALVNTDANYDNNQVFQDHHGYQKTLYRQSLNPGSSGADDLKLLARAQEEAAALHQPFYMMLWPVQTHHPYGREFWSLNMEERPEYSNEGDASIANDHKRYLHALHQADEWFGALISDLESRGLLENTTIVVTGDHGEAFGEHEPGNGFHGTGVYEESVHVPGFIYSPKITRPLTDERNIRLLDIPATILHIAHEGEYLFNDGRSIFKNYKYEMPIYLFNSWSRAIGIIYENQKLWRRTGSPQEIFLASIKEIESDPSKERQYISTQSAASLLNKMEEWEAAMKSRTARLLYRKDIKQPPLDDIFRIYCDDGNGFQESHKGFATFIGLSGKIDVPLNMRCQTLRLAPISGTRIPEGSLLYIKISDITITGHDTALTLDATKPIFFSGMTSTGGHEFSVDSSSPYIDYPIGQRNYNIQNVSMNIEYIWKHTNK